MRTIGVIEAVTFPGIDEILVRRRAPRGGMAVLERIPAAGCDQTPLHQVIVAALEGTPWQPASAIFTLPGDGTLSTETGVKIEVLPRGVDTAPYAFVPLTEDHCTALAEHALRVGEHPDGLDTHWVTTSGALMWDNEFVRMCFTGGHRVGGDFIRAWKVNQRGRWIAETDLPTDLENTALTARSIWQLIRILSDCSATAGRRAGLDTPARPAG